MALLQAFSPLAPADGGGAPGTAAPAAPARATTPLPPGGMRAWLTRLLGLLDHGDVTARDLVVEQADRLRAHGGEAGHRLVEHAMRFEMEQAREQAQALLADLAPEATASA